jgi:hypothetical protein
MNDTKKLIRCRVAMTETGTVRTAYVVCRHWGELDDWSASARCQVTDAELVAATDQADNSLTIWGGR